MTPSSQVVMPGAEVPSLARWGVSPRADLVYRTLTTYGPGSLEWLGRTLELGRKELRQAVDELHAVGVATVKQDSGTRQRADRRTWCGAPPSEAMTALRRRREQRVRRRQQFEQRLAGLLDLGIDLPSSSKMSIVDFTPLYEHEKVWGRRVALSAQTRSEFLSMQPESAFTESQVKRGAPESRSMFLRGVSILSLGVPASDDDESGKFAHELNAYGTRYRELPVLPARLTILDRRTALFRMVPDDPTKGMWEVTEPVVVQRLVDFFMNHWMAAVVPERGWTPPTSLTPRERAIIALLAAGSTDADVADHLGMSLRTVAYVVRNLMDQYEVRTRFQLGLVLGAEAVCGGETFDDKEDRS